jgi:8-oxo-dGTP diphosphatase
MSDEPRFGQPRRVQAAGGVVWRRARGTRALEVLLIHRPAYDDWSWPKGKPDRDETPEQTARREVEEETGVRCRLGPELASSRYVDGKGRDKVVRYWAMTAEEEHPRPPDDEVDEVRWVAADEADRMLSYDRDRTVLGSLRDVVGRV